MWDQGTLLMGRGRALKRGRLLSLLVAGFIGYLFGDWHAVMMRATELSASQTLRCVFPSRSRFRGRRQRG